MILVHFGRSFNWDYLQRHAMHRYPESDTILRVLGFFIFLRNKGLLKNWNEETPAFLVFHLVLFAASCNAPFSRNKVSSVILEFVYLFF